jgi:hypothetical protein
LGLDGGRMPLRQARPFEFLLFVGWRAAMKDCETEALRRWVACWKAAGARMEELRRERLRHIDTQQSLMNLADAFESCRIHRQPRPTSGLVEQQRWFRRLAK